MAENHPKSKLGRRSIAIVTSPGLCMEDDQRRPERLSWHFLSEFVSKSELQTTLWHGVKKSAVERPLCTRSRKKKLDNQSQSKPKSKHGFARDFGDFDRREHKAKRSDGRFKQGALHGVPHWALRKEPRSTDLTCSDSDLGQIRAFSFTSHTWLSDSKSPLQLK